MEYTYSVFEEVAVHIPSGLKFSVSGDYYNGIDITPLNLDELNTEKFALDDLTECMKIHVRNERAKMILSSLLNEIGRNGIRYNELAGYLSRISSKKVTVKTVQAWLLPFDRKGSRICPDWAIEGLKQWLKDHSEKTGVKSFYKADYNYFIEFFDKHVVDIASSTIEGSGNVKRRWKNTSLNDLSERIGELESKLVDWLCYHNHILNTIRSGLQESDSFNDFKKNVLAQLRERDTFDFHVNNTVRDIVESKNEFFSDDGTIKETKTD